jgi:hypothetical protein
MALNKKMITKLSDEIVKDWFGPTGECWCEEKKKFIDPEDCVNCCPECKPLNSQDIKQFRYLHLHDDFKSY